MDKFRYIIAKLIFDYNCTWLEDIINFLCELEMVVRNHPYSAVRKLLWNPEKIPKGLYCYDNNDNCPYLEFSKVAEFFYGNQCNGYCYYLGQGDFNSDTIILWDWCKCCGINEDIEGEECVECSLEL